MSLKAILIGHNPNLFAGIFEPIFDVDSLFVDQHRRIRLQQDSTPASIQTHQITFKNLSVPVRLPQPQSEFQPQVKAHRKHLFSRVKPLFAVIGKKCLYFIDPKISIKKKFQKRKRYCGPAEISLLEKTSCSKV